MRWIKLKRKEHSMIISNKHTCINSTTKLRDFSGYLSVQKDTSLCNSLKWCRTFIWEPKTYKYL